ncbi:MAG: hypothetical protein Q7R47_03920 [Candidatus Diapherotrites archaeon]|nr:hypothetical protein [Candidatus Diapherotrites archaeon]
MVLLRSLSAYTENFVTSVIFLLLGLLVFLFALLSTFFLSSGNVFLEFGFWNAPLADILLGLCLAVVSVALFSVFSAAMIFAVRSDLGSVRFAQFVSDKLPRFAMELFEFYLVLLIAELVISVVLSALGFPGILIALVLLVLNALLVFVPQSVIVDELSWDHAVAFNLHFIRENFSTTLLVWVAGAVLVGLLPIVELFFDKFDFLGQFVSLAVALVIVVPLFETIKTVAFMTKSGIVSGSISVRK